MMDFLRQLAPARETDAARALAVLPSRFSGLYPLQENFDEAPSARRLTNDETSLRPQAGLSPVASLMAATQRHAAAPIQPGQASPIPLAGQTRQLENEKAVSPAHVPAKALGAPEVPSSRATQNRIGDNAERTKPASPQTTGPAAAVLTAMPALQDASPPAPAQAWPLSDASLAQRTPKQQDDDSVVHVMIGRIEVVAHTAPAQAAARSPAPRQPSVTLADYLRGSHGGRP